MRVLRQLDEPPSTASTVHVIPHHRVSHRCEMYADLMRATGVEVRTQQVDRLEPRQSHEIRLRRSSCSDDCHALSVSRIAGQRLVDGETVDVDVPPRERGVAAHDAACREISTELAGRRVRLGDEEETGGFLVQTMNDPGAILAVLHCERAAPA